MVAVLLRLIFGEFEIPNSTFLIMPIFLLLEMKNVNVIQWPWLLWEDTLDFFVFSRLRVQ